MSLDPLTAAFVAVEDNADLLRGPEGPQGIQGADGANGADGRDGDPGPQGVPGRDGKDGQDGAAGLQGRTGERGPKGDKGEKGDRGIQGPPGSSGRRGLPTYVARPGGGSGGPTPDLAAVLAVGADAAAHAITGLADPTDAQDAATKAYVDANAGGGSGGGFTPVSCVLQAADQDIASADPYYILWGAADIIDNWADQGSLDALPDGIGLDLNSDNLTTNVAGVWALTMAYVIPTDLTWGGAVNLTSLAGPTRAHGVQHTADDPPVPVVPLATFDELSHVLYLPSGAQIATAFTTSDAATGATLMASAQLTIVRLA